MSVHDDITDWADRLADGSLDEKERAALEMHLQECDACAAVIEERLETTAETQYGEIVPDPKSVRQYGRILRGTALALAIAFLIVIGALFTAPPAVAHSTGGMEEVVTVMAPRRVNRFEHPESEDAVRYANVFGRGAGVGGKYGTRMGGTVSHVAYGGGSPAVTRDPREKAARAAQAKRRLIFNADLKIEVDAFEAVRAAVTKAVADASGFVASTSIAKGPNGRVRAHLTLRVPPAGFDGLVAIVSGLGVVRSQTVATEDVTKAYYDFESRLKAKEAFAARLRKVLEDGTGTVKELMEVEVQIGQTLEVIDRIKGELRYYDQHLVLSTIRLEIVENDIAAPFEYVETLSAKIGLVAEDVDTVLAAAQEAVTEVGGDAGNVRMSRTTDGVSSAKLVVRVPADRFGEFRTVMRGLAHVARDTVERVKSGVGGTGRGSPDAPVRKEEAVVEISLSTPDVRITRRTTLTLRTDEVDDAYAMARQGADRARATILEGSLTGTIASRAALLRIEVDVEDLEELIAEWRGLGSVVSDTTSQELSASPVPISERGELTLILSTPTPVIAEDQGVGQAVRDTLGSSWAGLVWSIEKLVVGMALSVPWVLLAGLAWLLWRRFRRKEEARVVPAD